MAAHRKDPSNEVVDSYVDSSVTEYVTDSVTIRSLILSCQRSPYLIDIQLRRRQPFVGYISRPAVKVAYYSFIRVQEVYTINVQI